MNMEERPLVSLLLATRNRREGARTVIEAVLRDKEAFPSIELIVVDGESSDGTKEMLASYGERIDRWISLKSGGPYGAWTSGLSIATGRYVRVLSDDDVYVEGCLLELAPYLRKASTDIVAGSVIYDGRDGSWEWKRLPWKPDRTTLNSFLRWPIWYRCAHESTFFSRELFFRYGAWNSGYVIAADAEIVARFLRKGATMVVLPIVVLHRVLHPEALSARNRTKSWREVVWIMVSEGKYIHIVLFACAIAAQECVKRFSPSLKKLLFVRQ